MKKHIKSLFSILTAFCLLVALFAFDVSAASVSVSGGGQYNVGQSFSVKVSFNADATLYAVEADISYNSSVLRLDGVSGADYNVGNGSVKIVDDGFSATKQSKSSSYTLSFTAIAAGNSNVSATVLGGGEAESKASGSAAISVVTPKPSSNANLASIKLSNGSLSPSFSANTTTYSATVKYNVDSITLTGAVADGGATYTGGGTFALSVGDNQRVLTVTAADGTKKSYTVNIKRMTELETAAAEQAERDANPLLVILNNIDLTIVNDFSNLTIPTGFTQGTVERKGSEITVINDESGKYQLCWLTDTDGNGAWYSRGDEDNYKKLNYINVNGKMYIVEQLADYGIMPTGFKLSTCTLDETELEAIAYTDENLKDFYIFTCFVDGATAYYRLDTAEGTVQRAADFDSALAKANNPDNTQKSNGVFAWFTDMNKTGKTVFVILAVVAVLIIALAVVLIVKLATSKQNIDFDGEPITNANEFILGDYNFETPEMSDAPTDNENAVTDTPETSNEVSDEI